MPNLEPMRINLSLVSHTNIGKTTLARTLLGRDIGEVADRPHVTETAGRSFQPLGLVLIGIVGPCVQQGPLAQPTCD